MKPVLKLTALYLSLLLPQLSAAQEMPQGFKSSIDMTVDDKGTVLCELVTKYTASYWDFFTRTVGNNTSILKNNTIRSFPAYSLTDFSYSQDQNERSNTIKFKIDGMMFINEKGKWMADLDKKNPDITKLSPTDFLVLQDGNSLKLHLPKGTSDAKVEKDNFGKAFLTYTADTGGGGGKMMLYGGIVLALAGIGLMYKNSRAKQGVQASRVTYADVPQTQAKIAVDRPVIEHKIDEPVRQGPARDSNAGGRDASYDNVHDARD